MGNISPSGLFEGLTSGTAVVRVVDNATGIFKDVSVIVYSPLASSGCLSQVMYDQPCDLQVSGGKLPYTYSPSAGAVNSGSFVHGSCGSEYTKNASVVITDALGKQLSKNISINCAYNYWGDGSDGNFTSSGLAANDQFCDTTVNGETCVKQFENFTINAGHTVSTKVRRRGLVIYVKGDAVINGTLTMKARGANGDPAAYGVGAGGLNFARKVVGQSQSGSSSVSGTSSSLVAIENLQSSLSGNGRIFNIPRTGAAGALALSPAGPPGGQNSGFSGVNGQSGGGGGGQLYFNNNTGGTSASAAGGAGTCFLAGLVLGPIFLITEEVLCPELVVLGAVLEEMEWVLTLGTEEVEEPEILEVIPELVVVQGVQSREKMVLVGY